jgi:hypothetical protein
MIGVWGVWGGTTDGAGLSEERSKLTLHGKGRWFKIRGPTCRLICEAPQQHPTVAFRPHWAARCDVL